MKRPLQTIFASAIAAAMVTGACNFASAAQLPGIGVNHPVTAAPQTEVETAHWIWRHHHRIWVSDRHHHDDRQ